jgi:hypothetical protein
MTEHNLLVSTITRIRLACCCKQQPLLSRSGREGFSWERSDEKFISLSRLLGSA